MQRPNSKQHPDGGWQHHCFDCGKPVEISWWRQFKPPSNARCIEHQQQYINNSINLLVPSQWE